MSIKDKYNKKPTEAPKPRGNRDVVSKLFEQEKGYADMQNNVNTEIQEPVLKKIKKATFELDAVLHKELKIAAVREGKTMVDIVESALKEYLNKLEN